MDPSLCTRAGGRGVGCGADLYAIDMKYATGKELTADLVLA